MLNPIIALFAWIGRPFISALGAIGRVTIFALTTVSRAVRPPYYPSRLFEQLMQIGWFSLPVVGMTAIFSGAALAQQTFTAGARFNATSTVPAIVVLGIVRELGPVLVGLMVAGRVSSAMAAELGTMRVTEQIDALRALGANPIQYLVVPRFLACFLLIPLLTAIADAIGIFGGWLIGTQVLNIDSFYWWLHSKQFIAIYDVECGLMKSFFFGGAIALVSCHQGFHCGAGAEGVGQASTRSFVRSFVAILVLDFFLGVFQSWLYYFLWPDPVSLF